jgi:6-phosphogluconolactonase (cycloisomerase 2 family)
VIHAKGGTVKRLALLCACIAAVAVAVAGAQAAPSKKSPNKHGKKGHAVFVQTNEVNGNRIVVFNRASNGQLTQAGIYATGGNGGVATPGTESDHLASQGSLVYDSKHKLLIAVNAGSDTVSTFKVKGNRLRLTGVAPSGGGFPASIAVSRKLVYVLNSGGPGIVQGFKIRGHRLRALAGSARSLSLANTDPPDFLTSPGQVGFTPDGRKLIVTTKASGSMIDVFDVGRNGLLSASPVVNASATPVPFAFTFDPHDRLVDGEAATSSVTTYTINGNGTLANPQSLSDNQMALCWIVRARGFYYVSNTASNNLSGYRISSSGQPSLVTTDGIVATTEAGPIDMAASGRFLYAQTGTGGTVDEYRIRDDGTLEQIGVVTGLPVGQEGIAAG